MDENIPDLPMREIEEPHEIFEAGRLLGLFEAEKIVKDATIYAGTDNNGVDRKQILSQISQINGDTKNG